MKKIKSLLIILFLIFVTGCGTKNYSENIIKVREKFNPWYLSSKTKAGEIYDKALNNIKWEEKDNIVIVKGIDKKTRKEITVEYEIKKNGIDMKKMTINGEEKSYAEWYKYMTGFIE